ncbi:MAG: ORF6N domain-containing protein [Proteobacteria bacterium]|nr:ORF6N domain-containing protein [Pseudomonadota bacterium]
MHEPVVIPNYIHTIRGASVMLDSDLAMMYGVEVKRINEAVKRNPERFPSDFMFQLTEPEYDNLRSQFATSSLEHGGRRYMPYVFTEQGVAMLSGVLKSPTAIDINIKIMRAFVAARKYFAAIDSKSKEISDLRRMLVLYMDNTNSKLSKHDRQLRDVAVALNAFLAEPKKPKRKIGFQP